MRISRVVIKNYRNLRDVDIQLENLVTLIGENNGGKSNFLRALTLPLLSDETGFSKQLSWYDINHGAKDPNNRVLFVFQDGHTEEHFWKDHSRKDSWDAEKRKKAAEKTKEQRRRRKEQTAQ